ncbi:pilus assembly protein TadG-related protein [Robertmurraya kyonggiensis]|nr:pilus assembly protein TadG-related protein [Robertmurraya kyonggiensis]
MKTNKLKSYLKNERGSGTLLIMVGMVLAAIFFGLLFFDFSNVFINKRVTQTGADAAAIAAAKTANDYMKDELQTKTQEELDNLGEEWEKFLEEALGDLEEEEEGEEDGDEGEETPPPDPPSTEELLDLFVDMKETVMGKSMPGDVRAWLLNHSVSVKALTAMKFFFDDEEVNEMSCKVVREHLGDAREEAEEYAEKNQNDHVTEFTFIPEDFRIYVETDRSGKYTTVPDKEVPAVTSESSAKIGDPEGYTISCS